MDQPASSAFRDVTGLTDPVPAADPVAEPRMSAVAAPPAPPAETVAAPTDVATAVAETLAPRRGRWTGLGAEVRRRVDAESDAYRAVTPAATADRKMATVLLTAALALTCAHFLSRGQRPGWIVSSLEAVGLDGTAARLEDTLLRSAHAPFWRLAFWAAVQITFYLVPAVVVIRLVFRERLRDYGLRISGILPQVRVYAVLFALAFPALVAASYTTSFQARYPFYDLAPAEGFWPYLWAWWALYALQFVALEFFFRGFLVHGLAPRLGFAAVFVMAVPYNMLHYGKPMPEALAAIVGGVVLGTLSLKTRSIWWGAALHITVAASMDLLSLWQQGLAF